MADEQWRPLSARDGDAEDREDYDALEPGVPQWLLSSLMAWVQKRVLNSFDRTATLRRLERECRIALDWRTQSGSALVSLLGLASQQPEAFLDTVDALLSRERRELGSEEELDRMLDEGGSLYRVVLRDETPRLERRVASEVEAIVTRAIDEGGRASRHLGRAWHDVYGRNPSPSSAYREAVRAVEAAAKPVVEPNNPLATLGTMIRAVENKKAAFAVALQPSQGDAVDALLQMMRVVWKSQLDRHGTDDESVPIEVSEREAEAAVHLAATLVHWFTSGVVART